MKNKLALEDNGYLISMVPVEELLRFGWEIGLDENSRVLDLCCGYGTLLKVWSETFGISGVGVDRNQEFLTIGEERLKKSGTGRVKLVCGDVTVYQDERKYDVVVCSETFGSIPETLSLGERFLKPGGLLAYQKLYAKTENPPQELIDFDGEVLSLSELNDIFNGLGYYITSMASDSTGMWEKYVFNWSGRRDLLQLAENREDKALENRVRKWHNMYFKYRRQYEGQALFGLKRV